jgi:hypothetical protein
MPSCVGVLFEGHNNGENGMLQEAHCCLSFHITDRPPPTKELSDIIDYCHRRINQFIIGCDANAHYVLWGSTSTSPKGESLMEYLVSSNLNILNQVNKPTFVVLLT